jgi:quercetin dioxygenase-like cupin family protein
MALQHAQSGVAVDLGTQDRQGGPLQTRALVKSESFEAIQLQLAAGKEIAAHEVAGKFTLLCLGGHVAIGLGDGDTQLASGHWIYFDGGVRHSVRAIEDSSLLLTIIF